MGRKEQLRELFAESDLFYALDGEDLDAVLSTGVNRKVAAGQALFMAGQPARQLYAVVSGQVKAVATAGDGREMVLRLFDPGDVFGEIALLHGGTRTATVVAAVDSELFVLDRRDFVALLRSRPDIAIELLAVLAGRMRSTTDQVVDTNFLEIAARLAKKVLELAESYGEPGPDGPTIRGSQEELGNQIAATRVSVNTHLKAWEKSGLVRLSRGRIAILDVEGLERVARGDA